MSTDFIPARESELVTWTGNFANLIVLSPVVYGLTVPEATDYQILSNQFISAYEIAQNGLTRSPANIEAKNTKKTLMIENARELARKIQGNPAVTPEQKIALGLNPRTNTPSPIPVPDSPPQLAIVKTTGNVIQVRLSSIEVGKRGKVEFAKGATVYTFVGENPPVDNEGWQYFGNTGRVNCEIEFSASLAAGTTVWITAGWYNPRGLLGPLCQPVKAMLLGGTEASNTGGLKAAA